jgi:hypothetical protein
MNMLASLGSAEGLGSFLFYFVRIIFISTSINVHVAFIRWYGYFGPWSMFFFFTLL